MKYSRSEQLRHSSGGKQSRVVKTTAKEWEYKQYIKGNMGFGFIHTYTNIKGFLKEMIFAIF